MSEEELQHVEKLEEYESLIKDNKFLVIDFFAEWCPPCKWIGPIYVEYSKIFTEAKFIKVDVDKADDICKKEKIECMPTFIFYKDGEKNNRIEGADKKELLNKLYTLTGKERQKEPGCVYTLEDFENSAKAKKFVAFLFTDSEKVTVYYKSLRKEEKYKEIELMVVDQEEAKEKEKINEKGNVEKFPTIIFFKDGKEEFRYQGESKMKLNENLEKLLGLPISHPNPYPTNFEEYKELLKKSPAVMSVLLSEYMRNFEKVNALIDKFEKDPEYAEAKFIRLYKEQTPEIHDPDTEYPTFVFFKDGQKKTNYKGEDESKIKKRLCKILGKPVPKIEGVIDDMEEFEAFIKENKLVAVDFFAVWCGPCQRISPVFHELGKKEEFKEIKFLKIDVDEAEEIAKNFSIRSMPTFLFIKEGKEFTRFSGADEGKLKKTLYKLADMPIPKDEGEFREVGEFEQFIKENKYVISAFIADDDKKDNFIAEKLLQFVSDNEKGVKTAKIYIEESKELTTKYNCTQTPVIIFFSDGKEVNRIKKVEPNDFIEALMDFLPPKGDPFTSKFHEHPLYINAKRSFICQKCNEGYFRTDVECWYCKICKFSLCGNCKAHEEKNEEITVREIIKSNAHPEHPLYFTKRSCFCDKCRKEMNESFCCTKCDFDLCPECYKIYLEKPPESKNDIPKGQ